MKAFIIGLFMFFASSTVLAQNIVLTCTGIKSTTISLDKNNHRIVTEINKEFGSLSLLSNQQTGKLYLFGNTGQNPVELHLAGNSFLELTTTGNVVLWNVFPHDRTKTIYVSRQVSYIFADYIMISSTIYKCRGFENKTP